MRIPAVLARRPAGAWSALLGLVLATSAVSADPARIERQLGELDVLAAGLAPRFLGTLGARGEHHAEERLIDGENFFRMKDYQRAAILLLDIIQNDPEHAVYPDAVYLFAESQFQSRDYYGAREWFAKVLDAGDRPGFGRFRQPAASRLVEIAIHLEDYQSVERYLEQFGQSAEPAARYVKGKYLYFKGDLEAARREFESIGPDPLELWLKARYFVGVVLSVSGRGDEAIEVFKAAAATPVTLRAEQDLIDLHNLGAGRLYFEKDFVENASDFYQRISRESPYFDVALYESAAVLVRSGDTIRAERTLEVLTVALPDSIYIPRAKLLRGNLLLRTGRYNEAERVFAETVDEFSPVLDQLDTVLRRQRDPRRFFAELTQRGLDDLDGESVLPPLVVKWVGEEKGVQKALGVVADLGTCGEYVAETEKLVNHIDAVVNGAGAIHAVPGLREARRQSDILANRLTVLRAAILDELGTRNPGDPALVKLAAERRGLEPQIAALPDEEDEFAAREQKLRARFDGLHQELSVEQLRLDQRKAGLIALERFVVDPGYVKVVPAETRRATQGEMERYAAGIEVLGKELVAIRDEVEQARYQLGLGGVEDQADGSVRERVAALATAGRAALAGRGGEGARFAAMLATSDAIARTLGSFNATLDERALVELTELRNVVANERQDLVARQAELRALRQEAEEVVGGVTYENFTGVRKRFRDLVIKADVGILDVSWLRKEEHTSRGTDLSRARAKELRQLDEEFREVRGGSDAAEQPAPAVEE